MRSVISLFFILATSVYAFDPVKALNSEDRISRLEARVRQLENDNRLQEAHLALLQDNIQEIIKTFKFMAKTLKGQ